MTSVSPQRGLLTVGAMVLFGIALIMPTVTPAYAAVSTSTKNPPYDHSATARYSSTGVIYCNPPQDTASVHARECASAFTSNGQIDVVAEAGLGFPITIDPVYTWAEGRINSSPGDSPRTACLSSDWFKFKDTYRWEGTAYKSDGINANSALSHIARIYRAADCSSWSGAFYQSFQGKLFQPGTPGVTTYFSGTETINQFTYGGSGVSGMFSVRLDDRASAIAANEPGAYAEANFWDGSSVYNQVQSIKSYSCTSSAYECASAP